MAYYNGKIQRNMLIDKLVTLLTTAPVGSSEPYWKKVNSGNFTGDGYILKSSGKTGSNDIYIRISNSVETNVVIFSTLENYVPNSTTGIDGVITGETGKASVYFHLAAYGESFPVEYFLSFDRDKVILALKGDPSVTGTSYTGLVWVGMPQRLAPDEDKTNGACTIACSKAGAALTGATGWANYSLCRSIRDRSGEANAFTSMVTMGALSSRSKGWGGEIMLPTIYLEDQTGVEGVRSIMDGIHPIYQDIAAPDFKNGDEIIKNSKRYIVLNVAYDGEANRSHAGNSFPSAWLAVEQLL